MFSKIRRTVISIKTRWSYLGKSPEQILEMELSRVQDLVVEMTQKAREIENLIAWFETNRPEDHKTVSDLRVSLARVTILGDDLDEFNRDLEQKLYEIRKEETI